MEGVRRAFFQVCVRARQAGRKASAAEDLCIRYAFGVAPLSCNLDTDPAAHATPGAQPVDDEPEEAQQGERLGQQALKHEECREAAGRKDGGRPA